MTFNSVIDTLYTAVISFTVRCIRAYTSPQAPVDAHKKIHEVVHDGNTDVDSQETAVEKVDSHAVVDEAVPTFKKIESILKTDTYVHTDMARNTIMYAGNVSVPVYKNPTMEFDAQIGVIPYGEMVMMLEPQGRFLKVIWNTLEGWVLKDDLVDRAIRVYPEFTVGKENGVDDSNTVHVRAIIKDEFGVSRSEFSLQAGEYVLYRLWKKGIRIEWPKTRPRVPGLWHTILKGVPRVHVGVTPKVGSVMEYMLNNDVGHLAYVEAVFPDNTITISEANFPDSGMYNERELTTEEWKELKPVFITVT